MIAGVTPELLDSHVLLPLRLRAEMRQRVERTRQLRCRDNGKLDPRHGAELCPIQFEVDFKVAQQMRQDVSGACFNGTYT